MELNEEFDMDSAEEYEMEEELQHFLNCEDADVGADQNIPMELCEFYFEVIGKLLGRDELGSDVNNVRRFFYVLRSLTDSWCQFKTGCKKEQRQLEDTLYYRIACIYLNSTCNSSAVAHHFGNFLNRNIRNEFLKKRRELRICSVGGGSPSDVVALVKVLESNVDEEDELDIHVSIIGGNKKWQNTCLVVLRCLARFGDAIWKIDFLQTDLFQPFSDEVTKAIESAGIVSMVKVFSELQRGRKNAGKLKAEMFQRVHRLVQPGSLVFFLDSYHRHVMHACGGYFGLLPGHCLLYEVVCDLYTLGETVVERHFRLYSDEFYGHMCNTAFLVFCRVWLKPPVEFHLKPIHGKFVKMQKQLEEMKKQGKESRRKFQLSYDSEMCSFKTWKDSTDLELRNMGRTRRQRNQVIRAAECELRKELKSRRTLMNSLHSERMRSTLQGQKELCDNRKIFVASKRDVEEVKLKIHLQSSRELVRKFKRPPLVRCPAS